LDEQREIINTFTEMAPRYSALMNSELDKFWGFTYEGFVSDFLKNIHIRENENLLDIATGTGFIPKYLFMNNGRLKYVYGLDLTFGMLEVAKKSISQDQIDFFNFFCASAHEIPIKAEYFDHIICCLATHHMNIHELLKNSHRCLTEKGTLHIADAGGSSKWKNRLIRFIIKSLAFIYFLFFENVSRARAESSAVANIHTADEWMDLLKENSFIDIKITEIKSRRFWAPNPLFIEAKK